jgi:DNA sulfur modification protein DndD
LNLDLVERLSADLQIYLAKEAKASAGDTEREEIDKLENFRQELKGRFEHLQSNRVTVQSTKLDHISSIIAALERKLRSEGSELAKVRDELVAEKSQLLLGIKQGEERLRELSAGTLVFALCPNTLDQLRTTLAAVGDRMTPTTRKKLAAATASVLNQFAFGTLNGSEKIDRRARKKTADILGQALKAVLKDPPSNSTVESVNHLSPSDRSRLLTWMDSALSDAAPEAKRIGDSLEKAARRLQKIETGLAQTPTDDTLKIAVAEMNDAHRQLGAAQQEAAQLDEEIGRVSREIAEVDRRLVALSGKLQEGQKRDDRFAVVKRSQAALKEYLIAVTELKLQQLEREVTQCFNAISRKGDLVHQIRVDPESFDIVLLDKSGQTIPKERLSAGEKQVFAIALLWALGRTSGRPLPVIIDTPLARLDSDHRKLLIERYLPSASHQVLVLSTDTEVDEALFAALEPFVSHAYHLQYDQSERYTTADAGYFWSRNADSKSSASPILHGSR